MVTSLLLRIVQLVRKMIMIIVIIITMSNFNKNKKNKQLILKTLQTSKTPRTATKQTSEDLNTSTTNTNELFTPPSSSQSSSSTSQSIPSHFFPFPLHSPLITRGQSNNRCGRTGNPQDDCVCARGYAGSQCQCNVVYGSLILQNTPTFLLLSPKIRQLYQRSTGFTLQEVLSLLNMTQQDAANWSPNNDNMNNNDWPYYYPNTAFAVSDR
eukprot:UN03257